MKYDDLTLVTCSYETPKITIPMMKSFVFHHGDGPHNIVIVENSRDEITRKTLEKNSIKYIKNPGGTHSPSVDIGLNRVITKYALLLDTDVLFLKPIDDLFDTFRRNRLVIMGELQESRGGYNLFPRISPHACFIDMEWIRDAGISFHDQEKIDRTGSNGFFGNIPLQKNNGQKYYDVGSSFLEEIQNHGLKVGKINNKLQEYVKHFEGMSWRTKSEIKEYVEWGNQVEKEYLSRVEIFDSIELRGKFHGR